MALADMASASGEKDWHPKVSVVIVAFNGRGYIRPLLDSLAAQSYPRECMEVVFVDNGSSDGGADLVEEEYGWVRLVRMDVNYGFAGGNNRAVSHASHDLLVFLNVDMVCHRHWLRELVLGLTQRPGLGACASNLISPGNRHFDAMDLEGEPEATYLMELSPLGFGTARVETGSGFFRTRLVSGGSFIIRRDLVGALGGLFEEDFWIYAEDTDLSLRICNAGLQVGVVGSSVAFHIHHSYLKAAPSRLPIAARAIRNRVAAFYRNMGALEFCLYFPVLLLGGGFKVFSLPLGTLLKLLYFPLFSLYSMGCMLAALPRLGRYRGVRGRVLAMRRNGRWRILRLMLPGATRRRKDGVERFPATDGAR